MIYAALILGLLPLVFMGGETVVEDTSDGDNFNPPDSLADAALAPVIEDDTGANEPAVGEDDALSPIVEDDHGGAEPTDEGALAPVDQSEPETFWVNYDETAGVLVADIFGFDPQLDILEVAIHPDSVTGSLDVDVLVPSESDDAEIYVEGRLIAILHDAAAATDADVLVHVTTL